MSKSLLSQVSLQELQEMRAQGMTNAQIANALGVGKSTVYMILGKQPDGLRATYGSVTSAVQDVQTEGGQHATAKKKSVLQIIAQTTKCEGANCQYTVYGGMGAVAITGKDGNPFKLQLDAKGLELYITELLDVLEMMTKQ